MPGLPRRRRYLGGTDAYRHGGSRGRHRPPDRPPVPEAVPAPRRQAADHPRAREGAGDRRARAGRHHLPRGATWTRPASCSPNHRMDGRFKCIVGGATRQESGLQGAAGARRRRLGDPPRGRPAARHARGVPGADREPGRERDVRQLAVRSRSCAATNTSRACSIARSWSTSSCPKKFDRAQAGRRPRGGPRRRRREFTDDASLFVAHSSERGPDPARATSGT